MSAYTPPQANFTPSPDLRRCQLCGEEFTPPNGIGVHQGCPATKRPTIKRPPSWDSLAHRPIRAPGQAMTEIGGALVAVGILGIVISVIAFFAEHGEDLYEQNWGLAFIAGGLGTFLIPVGLLTVIAGYLCRIAERR